MSEQDTQHSHRTDVRSIYGPAGGAVTFNVDELLANHRRLFGDARMEDDGDAGGDKGGDTKPDAKPDDKGGVDDKGGDAKPDAKPDGKPPWGDEPFDPDRAWKLIQELRSDKDQLKTERESLKTKVSEHERAQMSEKERAESERDEARQERDAARLELLTLRMAVKYQLDEDDLDLLGTGTEEEIEKRAKRLAERAAGSKPPSRKPSERLRGGKDPDENEAAATATPGRSRIAAALSTK